MEDTNTRKTWGTNREGRRDRNRRRRWFSSVHQCKMLTRGQKATAMGLAERSSDTAKPVWGRQVGFAKEIGCSDRQFRRDVGALERQGLVTVTRFAPERQADGSVRRPRTNIYVFCVPPGKPNRRKPSSPRQDTGVLQNHLPTEGNKTLRHRRRDPDPDCQRCDGLRWIDEAGQDTVTECGCCR